MFKRNFNGRKLSKKDLAYELSLAYVANCVNPTVSYHTGYLTRVSAARDSHEAASLATSYFERISKNPSRYHRLLSQTQAMKNLVSEALQELLIEGLNEDKLKLLNVLLENNHETTKYFDRIIAADNLNEFEIVREEYFNFVDPERDERLNKLAQYAMNKKRFTSLFRPVHK